MLIHHICGTFANLYYQYLLPLLSVLEILANAQQVWEEERSQSRLSRVTQGSFKRKGSTGKSRKYRFDGWQN